MNECDKNVMLESFSPFLYALGVNITCNVLASFFTHLRLHRLDSKTNIKIDALPESIRLASADKKINKTGIKKDLSICINQFIEVLSAEGNINLDNFYRNFKPYCIEVRNKFPRKTFFVKTFGEHNLGKITLLKGHERGSLFHELFHLASSYEFDDLFVSGFFRLKYQDETKKRVDYAIGKGLNEGYTQLLSERYFGVYGADMGCYPMLVNIALFIEIILGLPEMEKSYFEGNLNYVIDGLTKYISKEEAVKLIRQIDHIYQVIYNTRGTIPILGIRSTYNEVLIKLSKIFMDRFKSEFDSEDMPKSLHFIMDLNVLNTVLESKYAIGLVSKLKLSKRVKNDIMDEIAVKVFKFSRDEEPYGQCNFL